MKKRILMFLLLMLCLSLFTVSAFSFSGEGGDGYGTAAEVDSGTHITIEFDEDSDRITMHTNSEDSVAGSYTNILARYKGVAQAISGICIITALICFFFQVTKLGTAGDNQTERAAALKGILFCGIVIAVFGSLEVFVSFFWNALST